MRPAGSQLCRPCTPPCPAASAHVLTSICPQASPPSASAHVMTRVSSPGSLSRPSTNTEVLVKLCVLQVRPSSTLNLQEGRSVQGRQNTPGTVHPLGPSHCPTEASSAPGTPSAAPRYPAPLDGSTAEPWERLVQPAQGWAWPAASGPDRSSVLVLRPPRRGLSDWRFQPPGSPGWASETRLTWGTGHSCPGSPPPSPYQGPVGEGPSRGRAPPLPTRCAASLSLVS